MGEDKSKDDQRIQVKEAHNQTDFKHENKELYFDDEGKQKIGRKGRALQGFDTMNMVVAPPRYLKTPFGGHKLVTGCAPKPKTYRWGKMKEKERIEERRRKREE